MNQPDPGEEAVECEEIVYRALKKAWVQDEPVPAEAFIRRVRGAIAEDAVSIWRRKYTTAMECRLRLNRMRSSASLHVGRVRDLPSGFEFIPDPERNEQGAITAPGHCLLMNLPDPISDYDAAEFAASQLIKIARYVTPDQEDREHRERNAERPSHPHKF